MPAKDATEPRNDRPDKAALRLTSEALTSSKQKNPPTPIRWAVIAIVVILAIISLVWFVVNDSNNRDVPNLVGKSYAEAEALVNVAGPKLSADPAWLVEQVPSEFLEITEQNPQQGASINSNEHVDVSVQPRKVSVPNLVGQKLSLAEQNLTTAGLLIERINSVPQGLSDQFKDAISMWEVTGQSIDGDAKVDAGTKLVLSLDIPEVTVPDLYVEKELVPNRSTAQSSFEVSATEKISRELLLAEFQGEGYAPLSMSPASGDIVPAFTKVNIVLGIPMPDVVNEKIKSSESVKKLELMGFANVSRTHKDDTVVIDQNIEAGSVITIDTNIILENKPKGYAYRVSGNGSLADISWSQPGSYNTQQANATTLPWEKTFDPAMSGSSILSAYLSDDGDEITCQVLKDGLVIKEFTSTGSHAMVSCD